MSNLFDAVPKEGMCVVLLTFGTVTHIVKQVNAVATNAPNFVSTLMEL